MEGRNEIICNNFKEKYNLPLSSQIFILQMCWAQHDGQWFLKTKKNTVLKRQTI